jgi:hypothetical protein
MSVILETDSLIHATPATISRCGMLYLENRKCLKPKYVFNKWLRKLPVNLAGERGAVDIENYCNTLVPSALEIV